MHRLRPACLMRILALVSIGYGVALNVFLLIRWPLEERSGLVAFITEFLHLALLISLVLLPMHLLVQRRRAWALVHLLPAIMLVSSYGPLFLPRPAVPPNANETQFTVLSHNMLSGLRLRPGLVETLRQANADVVVLQEVNYGVNYYLGIEFKTLYPYQHFLNVPLNDFMVLSKFPLTFTSNDQKRDLFGYQRIVLDINGIDVVLYNAHLYSIRAARLDATPHNLQLNALLTAINGETGPVLLAGDFNMSDWSVGYSRITQRYRDAFRDVGLGVGFTAPDYRTRRKLIAWIPPISRVDMIFYSHTDNTGLRPLESYVWPNPTGSDHMPVLVRFALPTGPLQSAAR
jgi:endonuclease/exonuclease/phosphatase (EEP) superfamily protein YafD